MPGDSCSTRLPGSTAGAGAGSTAGTDGVGSDGVGGGVVGVEGSLGGPEEPGLLVETSMK